MKKIITFLFIWMYALNAYSQDGLGRISFSSSGFSDSRLSVTMGEALAGSFISSDGKTILTIGAQAGYNFPTDSLNLSNYSLTLNGTSSSAEIQVYSNRQWTINNSNSWLSITPNSGNSSTKITITALENPSTSSRSGSFNVIAGSINRTVSITQLGKALPSDTLDLSSYVLNVDANQNNKSIDIISNLNWTITNPASWVIVNPMSGNKNSTLNISIEANSGQARSTNISVIAGTNTKILSINQAAGATSIGESELSENELKVFPNPTLDDIHIWVNQSKAKNYQVSLFDMNGKLISQQISNEENTILKLSHLSQGTYFIQLSDGQSNFNKTIKVLKSNK